MGANLTVIWSWFTLLEKIKKTVGITSPDQIWSGDETETFWMTNDANFKIIQKIEAENAKKEEIQKEKENIKKEAVAKARRVNAAIKRKQKKHVVKKIKSNIKL